MVQQEMRQLQAIFTSQNPKDTSNITIDGEIASFSDIYQKGDLLSKK